MKRHKSISALTHNASTLWKGVTRHEDIYRRKASAETYHTRNDTSADGSAPKTFRSRTSLSKGSLTVSRLKGFFHPQDEGEGIIAERANDNTTTIPHASWDSGVEEHSAIVAASEEFWSNPDLEWDRVIESYYQLDESVRTLSVSTSEASQENDEWNQAGNPQRTASDAATTPILESRESMAGSEYANAASKPPRNAKLPTFRLDFDFGGRCDRAQRSNGQKPSVVKPTSRDSPGTETRSAFLKQDKSMGGKLSRLTEGLYGPKEEHGFPSIPVDPSIAINGNWEGYQSDEELWVHSRDVNGMKGIGQGQLECHKPCATPPQGSDYLQNEEILLPSPDMRSDDMRPRDVIASLQMVKVLNNRPDPFKTSPRISPLLASSDPQGSVHEIAPIGQLDPGMKIEDTFWASVRRQLQQDLSVDNSGCELHDPFSTCIPMPTTLGKVWKHADRNIFAPWTYGLPQEDVVEQVLAHQRTMH